MKLYKICGRLGNQLFQFAKIYTEITNSQDKEYGICFNEEKPELDFESLKYPPKFIENDNFLGWFEDRSFFNEDLIREIYSPSTEKLDEIRKKYGKLDNTLFICVRRGDFVEHKDIFICCNNIYYEKACKMLLSVRKYDKIILTSDDIEWCKQNINIEQDVIYIENEKPLDVVWIASCCKDFVISSSTFSWWCAYLGSKNGGVVVTPGAHFRSEIDEQDNRANLTYFPKNWITFKKLDGLYEK